VTGVVCLSVKVFLRAAASGLLLWACSSACSGAGQPPAGNQASPGSGRDASTGDDAGSADAGSSDIGSTDAGAIAPSIDNTALRKLTLALTGVYPTPEDLEKPHTPEELTAALDAMLATDGFLDVASGWLFEWLSQENAYRYVKSGTVTYQGASDNGLDLEFLGINDPVVGLYPAGNPFYIKRLPSGDFEPQSYGRVMTQVRDAYLEPALVWRRILKTNGDVRDLLRAAWTVRSPELEGAYAIRESRSPRDLSTSTMPYRDALSDATGGNFYVTESLRGSVGITGTMSFLNVRKNGRTRSNLVVRSFLCRTIPIADTSTWTPPAACDPGTDPRCESRSHVSRNCAACHNALDPLARLWERYQVDWPDSRFITIDGVQVPGVMTDPSGGYVDGTGPYFANGTATVDVDGLTGRIVADPDFPRCLAERTFTALTGRRFTADETSLRDGLTSVLTRAWSFKDLVRAIAMSAAFRGDGSASPGQPGSAFDAVWALMNRPHTMGGCQGCHVGPAPVGTIPYYGDTSDNVLATLKVRGLLAEGRLGRLAVRVSKGEMPPSRPWAAADIDTLMQWLRGFDSVGATAPSLDRYRLASALAAVRGTPGAGGLIVEGDLYDRFAGNWPIERPNGYSAVGLLGIDVAARRTCTEAAMPKVSGLPDPASATPADIDRALHRISLRFLGIALENTGLDLQAIYKLNGGGAAGLGAACFALTLHPSFTQ